MNECIRPVMADNPGKSFPTSARDGSPPSRSTHYCPQPSMPAPWGTPCTKAPMAVNAGFPITSGSKSMCPTSKGWSPNLDSHAVGHRTHRFGIHGQLKAYRELRVSTLFLVRHGETDWNRSGQIMGEQPVPMNQNGEAQVKRLATFLKSRSIHALYSSPVVRALQTAEILASALQVPVTADRGLTEINVGEWEGRYWKHLTDEFARQQFYTRPEEARPPGGETLSEVQTRAVAAVERARTREGADRLLFVSHADVVRTILAHYLRLDLKTVRQLRIDHASLTALEINGTLADLLFLNYTTDPGSLS